MRSWEEPNIKLEGGAGGTGTWRYSLAPGTHMAVERGMEAGGWSLFYSCVEPHHHRRISSDHGNKQMPFNL